ncbi:MAG: polysaccharide biosynthesis protein [Lachnospiraceae bacterium]|nr:polysaccharide biosynthesis protein [Lachnospiraceae bacterium]
MDGNQSKEKRISLGEIKKSLREVFHWEHWKVIAVFLFGYDLVTVNLSYFLALLLRFDLRFSLIEPQYVSAWIKFVPVYSVIVTVVFLSLRMYRSMWRFASYTEVVRVTSASLISGVLHACVITIWLQRMPISYYIVGFGLQFLFTIVSRFAYRFALLLTSSLKTKNKVYTVSSRVMLIGAGQAGQMILRDMHSAKELNDRVVCIIDDLPNKWGRTIDGVPIVGGRDDILTTVEKYKVDKIVLAIPSATAENRRDILSICQETGCTLMNLPGMFQLVNGEIKTSQLKEVQIEDLLGRETVQVNSDEILGYLNDKVILVTGGGGSIGSELCRQIAAHNPRQLVIFDIYENNAHAIRLELEDKYPDLNLVTLIGSVRDVSRLNQVFRKYHPDIVFHAAAHKHVPLMEGSPREAIKNNAIGTYKTAYAAMAHGVKRFVLISTDKAVNPTNIMGASKRLCEMVIQTFDRKIKEGKANELPVLHLRSKIGEDQMSEVEFINNPCTEFVAVRFGNVLGSNGSVIPRFREQIAKGGPVTVTHPDIIRYFMTIPEAASLVLQAGTYAKGGEIFVLDMGAPVQIDSLARNMIKLSGLTPDVDIKIEYTGLRPGEKLYEEKLMNEEGMRKTPNNLIYIGNPVEFDTDQFLEGLQDLMEAAYEERKDIRQLVSELVPTYHPAGKNGSEEKGEVYNQQLMAIEKHD